MKKLVYVVKKGGIRILLVLSNQTFSTLNLYYRSSLSPIVDTAHLSDVIIRLPDSFAVLDPELQSLDASTLSNGSAQ